MHEHREWPRYSAERRLTLSANLDGKLYLCTVADVSLGGARLVFDDDLPAETGRSGSIELLHPDAEPVICEPIWRSRRELGIQFDFSEESLGLVSVCVRNIVDHDSQTKS
ncbi:PilZ domain-containing protein [Pelagibius sp.]|uniref:PilZ domain-containing protein n=1 Tax=Pelagibius sp. TaxID=1931238 RepID=UPI003B508594